MPGQLYRTNPSAAALTRPTVWNRVGVALDAREGAATAATRPAAVAVTRALRDKRRGGGGCMWPSFGGGDGTGRDAVPAPECSVRRVTPVRPVRHGSAPTPLALFNVTAAHVSVNPCGMSPDLRGNRVDAYPGEGPSHLGRSRRPFTHPSARARRRRYRSHRLLALSWHTARSHSGPRSSRSRAWSWCR